MRPSLRLVAIAALCAGLSPTLPAQAGAIAAPTRLEAENATVSQGAVESNHAGFSGTGFVNGDNVAGPYVEWTFDAPSAGTATLSFRYANGTSANRPSDISVNGTLVADDRAFAPTGAWSTWATATLSAPVVAGANTVRATAAATGGNPNWDYLDADLSAAPGTDLQAENATISQGAVESNHAGYTGTGFVNYDNVAGSYVQFTVNAASAGTAPLTFRYANGTAGNRPVAVSVNNGTPVNLDFPVTSSWTDWREVTVNAALSAGANSVRATATGPSGGPNLDRLSVGSSGGGGTPVAANGQLRVCGVKLCNENGKQIQLRGMSSHGLQWHYDCLNTASLDALAEDWKSDVLRISMYIQEEGYDTNPRMFTDRVHNLIEQATARGMYAIVDWHMLNPGDPFANGNLNKAKTFFTEIAQRHNGKKNLLYEIMNEPSGVNWSRIRDYAHQIIPVIRANDPDTTILVGTPDWSSLGVSGSGDQTDTIRANPVNAANIMYTFHFYAASHGSSYYNTLSRAADLLPMFVTEFGTQTFTGGGGNDFTQSQRYLDLMAQKKISWVNWNFSDDPLSGAAFTEGTCPSGPFAGTSRLKPAGAWIRDRVRTPDDF
ncbi:cellulase family glycosylhydrolase [Nonomuraea longicatena]|uniref:cellulase n=1 Tax=Nonomuraea longicatena TaxID=83682 RepID=A0ABP4BMS0_9ACTN